MKKHLNIKIYGQVQGVNFRHYTKKQARELGLFGFARNEKDGAVFIEAEGDEKKLKDFLAWCGSGPEWAAVEKVEHEFSLELKDYQRFVIYN